MSSTTRTFSFRNSKDKNIAIYLGGRVVHDQGSQGIDSLEGVIKVKDPAMAENANIFVRVHGAFTYESSDGHIINDVFYEQNVKLFPNPEPQQTKLTLAQKALVKKVGGCCHPYNVQLPKGLPASVVLKPETYFEGSVIGISYAISAYLTKGSLKNSLSNVVLPFQKVNVIPVLEEAPKPLGRAEKNFMFSTNSPLTVTATLPKEVFYHGESIMVTVDVSNLSKKEVCAIKISAKQITTVTFGKNGKEKFKSQVALLESTRNCPLKKGERRFQYSITPRVLPQENHHPAQEFKLNLTDPSKLASSTRVDSEINDVATTVTTTYYMNVHCVVSMGSDLRVKLPFSISHKVPPKPVVVKKKVTNTAQGSQIEKITRESHMSMSTVDSDVDLLIDFDTAVEPQAVDILKAASAIGVAPDTVNEPMNVEDCVRILTKCIGNLERALSSASTQTLYAVSEEGVLAASISDFTQAIKTVGTSLSQLLEDVSMSSTEQSSGSIQTIMSSLSEIIRCLVHLSDACVDRARFFEVPDDQTRFLTSSIDVFQKCVLLCETVRDILSNGSMENRSKLSSIAEYISQAFPHVVSNLPGQRSCQAAIETISSALSQLQSSVSDCLLLSGGSGNPFASEQPGVVGASGEPLLIPDDVDRFHAAAMPLSNAFKSLGASTASDDMRGLSHSAHQYQCSIPRLFASAHDIISHSIDVEEKNNLLKLVENIASSSISLLGQCKLIHLEASELGRRQLEKISFSVIESMRQALDFTFQMKTQYKNKLSAPLPVSGGPTAHVQESKAEDSRATLRRDSFEEFINVRASSAARLEIADASPELTAEYNKAEQDLKQIERELDQYRKMALDYKRLPRRMSLVVNQPILPNQTCVLDTVMPVLAATTNLINNSRLRIVELSILGKAFHAKNFSDKDTSWTRNMVSAASQLVRSCGDLVATSHEISQGAKPVGDMAKVALGVNSNASVLVASSQVQEYVSSTTQQEVESACRQVAQATNALVSCSKTASEYAAARRCGGATVNTYSCAADGRASRALENSSRSTSLYSQNPFENMAAPLSSTSDNSGASARPTSISAQENYSSITFDYNASAPQSALGAAGHADDLDDLEKDVAVMKLENDLNENQRSMFGDRRRRGSLFN
eukprot:Nk52_evm1s1779 gene=Nk52_evmTU1s1779